MKKTGVIFICLCLMLSVFGMFGAYAQETKDPGTEPAIEFSTVGEVKLYWNYQQRNVGQTACIVMEISSNLEPGEEIKEFTLYLAVTENAKFNYIDQNGNASEDNTDKTAWTVVPAEDSPYEIKPGYILYKITYSGGTPFTNANRWIDFVIESYGNGYASFYAPKDSDYRQMGMKEPYANPQSLTTLGRSVTHSVSLPGNTRASVTSSRSSAGGNILQELSNSDSLPETGFSSSKASPLSNMPKDLNYQPLHMMLEIPALDLTAEVVKIPNTDGKFHIEWLGNAVGLLEGSALPGEGISVLTGHNHLNNTDNGPFLALGVLERGDRIFTVDSENERKSYIVYANEQIAENDVDAIIEIASMYENSITMITCENEKIDGGYANRRIVAARLLEN